MAIFALTDAYLTVNAVDLSDHVRSIGLKLGADEQDTTAMGTSAFRSVIAGMKNWSLDVEFNNDLAAGSVNATLYPLLGATPFQVEVRANKTQARGTTNPGYLGPMVLLEFSPIAGKAGDLNTTQVTFKGSGTLAQSTT